MGIRRTTTLSKSGIHIRVQPPRYRFWSRRFQCTIWDDRRMVWLPAETCRQLGVEDLVAIFEHPEMNKIIMWLRERKLHYHVELLPDR